MRISVTQSDIDSGVPIHGSFCPIALAIKRRFKGKVRVSVSTRTVKINGKFCDFLLPEKAQLFVRNFDNKQPVKPFRFDMDL